MNPLTAVMLAFALLGAFDRIIGNKLGLGKEFERGFNLLGPMALSMVGMIIIAPAIGEWLMPVFEGFYSIFHIDPSIIPASIFANDMGGTPLSMTVMKSEEIGMYNTLVVSSIMGAVISYTIPFGAGIVNKSQHKELFFGFLCGIVAIPIGCFFGGIALGLSIPALLLNLLPLLLLSLIIVLGLIFIPDICVTVFRVFGFLMKALITIGLAIGIFTALTGIVVFEKFESINEGARICFNASITLAGAFPLMFVISKILKKPMSAIGKKIGINATSAVCLLPNLVTNATTFGMMADMDKRGLVLNSALTVTVAFVFGSHLGFTMAYDERYVLPMIIAKLTSGVIAVALVLLIYKDKSEIKTEKA
ncbi:MAG: ethanolamine utilization protein EutH [Clostridia bacterium]|nr:ethanolamine utilization protein EutH [Clostridia bacterium]